MELTIKDRLCIPSILLKDGNFRQFNHKKEILRKINIDEKTREEVNLREDKENNRVEWEVNKDIPLIIDFSADEISYLKESCEALADQILPDEMWGVVEKIYDATRE